MTAIDERTVFASTSLGNVYPDITPFHPQEIYPEYSLGSISDNRNDVYDGVWECFCLAGLDEENSGIAHWNPLAGLIRPGETVLLKPNFVKENHPRDQIGRAHV